LQEKSSNRIWQSEQAITARSGYLYGKDIAVVRRLAEGGYCIVNPQGRQVRTPEANSVSGIISTRRSAETGPPLCMPPIVETAGQREERIPQTDSKPYA
jgi:hypothetical protein